ncbi:MAG: zf-HC2 domain-containing protein [Thermomicrobiales bacterium]|nr:zf-HC2 domain-containing protein [Thermomicrobiales bacterium]
MISHDRARRLISERLDDSLAPADMRALHEHLTACPDCRRFADQAALLMQDLRELPHLPASSRVTRAVLEGIEAEPGPWAWMRRGFAAASSPGMAIASSLALVAALAGTIYLAVNPDDGPEPSATISAIAIAPQETATPTAVPTMMAAPTMIPEPSMTPVATVAARPTAPAPTAVPTAAPAAAEAEATEPPDLAMSGGPAVETPPAEEPPAVSDAPSLATSTPEPAVRRGKDDQRPVSAADTSVISSAQSTAERAVRRATKATREDKGDPGVGNDRKQSSDPTPDVAQIAQMVTPEATQPETVAAFDASQSLADAIPTPVVAAPEPSIVDVPASDAPQDEAPPTVEEVPATEPASDVPAESDDGATDETTPTDSPAAPPIVPVETPDLAAVAPAAVDVMPTAIVVPPDDQDGAPVDQGDVASDPALPDAPAPDAAALIDQTGAAGEGDAIAPAVLAGANEAAGAGAGNAAGTSAAAGSDAAGPYSDVPVTGSGQGLVQRRYGDGRIELRAMTPGGGGYAIWSGMDGGLFGSGVASAIVTSGGDRVAYLTGGVLYVAPVSDPNAAVAVPIGTVVGYDWSPAGDRLAVSNGYGIEVFGPNGEGPLISVGEPGGIPIGPIDWLPNGISVTSWDGSETVLVPV